MRSIGSLAERMGVTPGATTRLVDGMIDRGWLERADVDGNICDNSDARAEQIS